MAAELAKPKPAHLAALALAAGLDGHEVVVEPVELQRSTAVILPLHCRYIAVTLPLHCRYVAVMLPSHCRHIAVTLPLRAFGPSRVAPLHCRYVAVTLPLHYRYSTVTLSLHCRYIYRYSTVTFRERCSFSRPSSRYTHLSDLCPSIYLYNTLQYTPTYMYMHASRALYNSPHRK